jgi:D-glycero-alpha-D-manno-heptose-7-phosphate kinase
MIISKTPFRISFFGGGTDFPAWYRENTGAVLSTTIDKYCYISCRRLPPFFEYRHRIVYSRHEQVNKIDEIVHPSVRETFRFMDIKDGLEIHHDGDLPARTGLGSSSAFTVGLLHALYALKGKMVSKKKLALDAIHVEQAMIKENVGSQDQVAAAFGGLNKISFSGDHNIEVIPVTIGRERIQKFEDHLMLFFSGFARTASEIEAEKIKHLSLKENELMEMQKMVDDAFNILNMGDLVDFGKLLNENWKLKKTLSDKVSNNFIDHIYEIATKNGAIGGKILGAGGGGFILFFIRPEDREQLIKALGFLLHVPFHFDTTGSQIIYYTNGVVQLQ